MTGHNIHFKEQYGILSLKYPFYSFLSAALSLMRVCTVFSNLSVPKQRIFPEYLKPILLINNDKPAQPRHGRDRMKTQPHYPWQFMAVG